MSTQTSEPDTRGIDVLSDMGDDNVTLLPALIFDQLFEEMFEQLVAVDPMEILVDMVFQEEPWRDLPTIEDLQYLWLTSDAVEQMITRLALVATGGRFDELPNYLMREQVLADMELRLKRGVGDEQAAGTAVDVGGSGEAAAVASAASGGGGGDLAGGPEDGDTVGEGEEVAEQKDTGGTPQVPRRRRSKKAGRGSVDDATDDPPAAA